MNNAPSSPKKRKGQASGSPPTQSRFKRARAPTPGPRPQVSKKALAGLKRLQDAVQKKHAVSTRLECPESPELVSTGGTSAADPQVLGSSTSDSSSSDEENPQGNEHSKSDSQGSRCISYRG